MNNGYAICFNEWALDKDIKNELGLLLIISSLCAEKGYCYASNKYFSEMFNIPEQTISRKLKILQDKKYITIDYKKRGCEITDRYIRLTKMLIDDYQNCESTINKNVKENNISINNISINNKENNISKDILKESNKKSKVFVPPTLEEVQEYCIERNNNVDAKAFYDYFNEGDWKDSQGNKVKNWKQKIITWEKYNFNKNKSHEEVIYENI